MRLGTGVVLGVCAVLAMGQQEPAPVETPAEQVEQQEETSQDTVELNEGETAAPVEDAVPRGEAPVRHSLEAQIDQANMRANQASQPGAEEQPADNAAEAAFVESQEVLKRELEELRALYGEATSRNAGLEDDPVARGQYLAHGVAKCIECHTPRNGAGNLVMEQKFRGATIPTGAPNFRGMEWAERAPDIRGFRGFNDEEVISLLSRGIVQRRGLPPHAPMPQFQMNKEDALAVAAYLRSLH